MKSIRQFFASLFLDARFFIVLGAIVVFFILGYIYAPLLAIARIGFIGLCILLLFELLLLYRTRRGIAASREMAERLSNGDNNDITIILENGYPFPIRLRVIDELPEQFQVRNFHIDTTIPAGQTARTKHSLRPVTRGEYNFGAVNVYAATPISLVRRRFKFEQGRVAPVYPSYIQMRKYELMAISNRLVEAGIKKIRRVGVTMEFDQIRDYVAGDDYRTINWKATARKAGFMVNQYQDERSQQVYSLIDKGRTMKMPFAEMTLLDYAINSALVISNVAIHRQDKAGLLTFANTVGSLVPADRRRIQLQKIIEVLYNQKTDFKESDFGLLNSTIQLKITSRSLLLLYTNFETLSGMQRQLPNLRSIARRHLLVVIFFENTELLQILQQPATTTEQIYRKAVAEKIALEKKHIVKELNQHGIHTILTPPEQLTVNTINKYLELKARRLI